EDSGDKRRRGLVLAARQSGCTRVRRAVPRHGQDHDARRVLCERPAWISVQARRAAAAQYGDEIDEQSSGPILRSAPTAPQIAESQTAYRRPARWRLLACHHLSKNTFVSPPTEPD